MLDIYLYVDIKQSGRDILASCLCDIWFM